MAAEATQPERLQSDQIAGWMRRYGADLQRHLTGMLGAEDDAEDVLQSVWLSAYRTPPDMGPGSNVKGWLFRVATNAALDRLARDRRRRAALNGRAAELVPDEHAAPDEGLWKLSEQARARIRERCARLPRKQREAVWLRWVEGDDYATIAGKLGCSEESARANVYNGMKRLRRELFVVWKEEYGR
ncbi:MAG: RNA polymerase sigma factor [Gemmatimonadetes bacterium]|nr:RNA polymerase sigma factor [Gemmatimonadota bacterium]